MAPGRETTGHDVRHREDAAVRVLSEPATATFGGEAVSTGPGGFVGDRGGALAPAIVKDGPEVPRMPVIGGRLAQDAGDDPRQRERT